MNLSKYSQKIERRTMELRKEKRKQEEERKKFFSPEMKMEKKMVRRNLKKINEIEKKQNEENDEIIKTRRELRKRYLESLKFGDIKLIEHAKKSMLSYDIKLKQQETERDL